MIPKLEDFLEWSVDDIARFAPATVVYAPAGTRRQATLDKVPQREYSGWAMNQLAQAAKRFFEAGVENIIVPILGPGQLRDEEPEYSQQVLSWVVDQACGPALQSSDFQVQMVGSGARFRQELSDAAKTLRNREYVGKNHCLWLYVVVSPEDPWKEVIEVSRLSSIKNREDISLELFGRVVPAARLLVGFGRPMLHTSVIPPILLDNDRLDCYWLQRPGFSIKSDTIRKVIYDSVFIRSSDYDENRLNRYANAEKFRSVWDNDDVIGFGYRSGGFWFPHKI